MSAYGWIPFLTVFLIASPSGVESTTPQKGAEATPQPLVVAETERKLLPSGPGRKPFDVTRHSIPLDEIRGGGPPIDGIPALGLTTPPRFIAAGEASWLDEDDRVIGVRLGGEARAYPLQILNWHEVVNDVFHPREDLEEPVAVVY